MPFPLRDHKRATGFRRHFAPLADPARPGHDLLDAFKRRGIALDALNGRRRAGTDRRDTGAREHLEIVIAERVYRVRRAQLRQG